MFEPLDLLVVQPEDVVDVGRFDDRLQRVGGQEDALAAVDTNSESDVGSPFRPGRIGPMFDRATPIRQIRAAQCPCPGCLGPMTAGALSKCGWSFCRVCRSASQAATPDGHDYPATGPAGSHRP